MRRVILAVVGTAAVLVLLLSFKTHSLSAVTTPPAAIGNRSGSAAPSRSAVPSRSAAPSQPAAPGAASTASKTVTGDAADTIYGPVQVQVTVKGGKVTAVQAVEYPENTPRDEQINAYAIPALDSEALAAGSTRIDAISGATYTSDGYITSLQSALDKAGL
jgi:uncharacterized protein with FMN-binding domain